MSKMDMSGNARPTLQSNEEMLKIKEKKIQLWIKGKGFKVMSLWFRLLTISTFEAWAVYIHTPRDSSRTHDKRELLSLRRASSADWRANHVFICGHLLWGYSLSRLRCYFIILRRPLSFPENRSESLILKHLDYWIEVKRSSWKFYTVLKIILFSVFKRFNPGRNMGSLWGFEKPWLKDAQAERWEDCS